MIVLNGTHWGGNDEQSIRSVLFSRERVVILSLKLENVLCQHIQMSLCPLHLQVLDQIRLA